MFLAYICQVLTGSGKTTQKWITNKLKWIVKREAALTIRVQLN
jgi:hypothetical protein